MDRADNNWIECPINIAIIKYWGKRNEALNLALNDSLSVTLDSRILYTITSVREAISTPEQPITDHQLLYVEPSGIAHPMPLRERTRSLIKLVAELSCDLNSPRSRSSDGSGRSPGAPDELIRPLHIETSNSFPTGAGLASSASGLSALALAYHYGLD